MVIMSLAGTQHLYSSYTASIPHTHTYLWPPVVRQLAARPEIRTILDAGCGNGAFASALEDRGYEVFGIDLEESGVEIARGQRPSIPFEVASVYDDLREPFDRTFDAIVALEVIEHLYDPRRFVARAFEALEPGGSLILSTPYHGYLKNLALAATGKLDQHFTALWDGGHIKFWSRKTLSTLLEEAGFEVTAFEGAGRLPWLWMSMVMVGRRP
jgi:2-polyprenyl-6-hydroxyphenyl methylase/3-demethylubiquinone-9 3-methyltransferase